MDSNPHCTDFKSETMSSSLFPLVAELAWLSQILSADVSRYLSVLIPVTVKTLSNTRYEQCVRAAVSEKYAGEFDYQASQQV